MYFCDVNVLLEAFHPEATRHGVALKFLLRLLNGQEPFGWSSITLSAVVRISTSPGVFSVPATVEEVLPFCNAIASSPKAISLEPNPDVWARFEQIVRISGISGRRTTDAFFAALAIESRAKWVTWDRDFRSISGLRVLSVEEALSELGVA